MGWAALVFLILAVALGAAAIQTGGNARAHADQMWALLFALGAVVSLASAAVLGIFVAIA